MIYRLSQIISTLLYLGYLPFSASLASLPALFIILQPQFNISQLLLLVLLATIFSDIFSRQLKQPDPKFIIIDELVGQLTAFSFILPTPVQLFTAILLFRFFDLTKPGFIKTSQKLPGGIGIVVDDLLAGVLAGVATRIIFFFL